MDWFIYTLKNPRTMEVRYVGWRSKSAAARLRHHIQESISKAKTHKHHWILSLVSIGLTPLMETVESGSGPGWAEAERKWIAQYRAQGARLVNATDGGDGVLGWGTPEQRSAVAKKAAATFGSERRSEVMRRRNAEMTLEQRQKRFDRMRATNAALSREQHSERMRAIQASKTPEQRKEVARKARAKLSPEQWSAARQKAAEHRDYSKSSEVMKLYSAAITAEQRRDRAKKRLANTTHEERSAASKRGHVTRAANKARRAQSG